MPRGAKPGERRGGRAKGQKNRATLEIEEKLRKLGCDPIEGMAMIAMAVDTPTELKARMFAELAQYILPKRKATEHSGPEGGPIIVSWLPPPAA